MTRRQLGVCALAVSIALGVAPAMFGQQVRPQAALAKPERPQAEPVLRVEALPPALEQLLRRWEQESAKIKTLTGKHIRKEYNSVFEVEKRTEGKFFFQSPDKGRIDMNGAKIGASDVSDRKNKEDKPYRLQSGTEERWICTGKDVYQINDKAKEYEVTPIPAELQGTNIIHSPLPFLFGMKAIEAKQRFDFELLNQTPEYYSLKVTPKTGMDAFKYAYVKLDSELFIPTAVILVDAAGTLEQRYFFSEIKVNDSGFAKLVQLIFGLNPFQPNLSNYKRVQTAHVEPAGAQAPAGQKAGVQSAIQKQGAPATAPAVSPRGVSTPSTKTPTQPPKSAGKF